MGSFRSRLTHSDSENFPDGAGIHAPRSYRAHLIGYHHGNWVISSGNQQSPVGACGSESTTLESCKVKGWLTIDGYLLVFQPQVSYAPAVTPISALRKLTSWGSGDQEPVKQTRGNESRGGNQRFRAGSECTGETLVWPINTIRSFGFHNSVFNLESGRKAPKGEGCFLFEVKNVGDFRRVFESIRSDSYVDLLTHLPPDHPHHQLLSLPPLGGSSGPATSSNRQNTYLNIATSGSASATVSRRAFVPPVEPNLTFYYQNVSAILEASASHQQNQASKSIDTPADMCSRARLGSSVSDTAAETSHYYNLNGSSTPPDAGLMSKCSNSIRRDEDDVFLLMSPLSSQSRATGVSSAGSSLSPSVLRSSSPPSHHLHYATIDFDHQTLPNGQVMTTTTLVNSSDPGYKTKKAGSNPAASIPASSESKQSSLTAHSPTLCEAEEQVTYVYICDKQTLATSELIHEAISLSN